MAGASNGGLREPFRLGRWIVEPELGRISRGDEIVQLRPRAMEVLVSLARLKGGLASKQHLIDTVWRTEFVSDNALTHVIAELRTALGDDSENPEYIETISRRGYRVIAPVTLPEAEADGVSSIDRTELIGAAEDADAERLDDSAPTGRPRSIWLAPGAVVAVGVIAIGLWVVLGEKRAPDPDDLVDFVPNRVVVAEFENRVGDPSFDDVGARVADSITALLRQVDRLTVATNPYRSPARGEGRQGEPAGGGRSLRIAEITRAGLVVTGACYSRGDQLEFEARIVDPWRNEVRQTFETVRAPLSDPAPAFEILSQQVAGTLALHVNNIVPLGLSRPVSLAAVREFAGAAEDSRRPFDAAISRLERALEIDPGFYLARWVLLRYYASRAAYREAEAQLEWLERHLSHMTQYDRCIVRAGRAQLERRPLEVLSSLREAVDLAENTYWTRNEAAKWAIRTNHPREAVELLSGIPVDWTSGHAVVVHRPFVNLCFAHHMLGADEAALRLAKESAEHFPDSMIFYGLQANILGVMGRFEEMNGIIEESFSVRHHTRTSAGVSLGYTARELRAHGYHEHSLDVAERAVEWFRERPDQIRGDPWFYAAALNAAERWHEARDFTAGMVDGDPSFVRYSGLLGVLEARTGRANEARRIAAELRACKDGRSRAECAFWRACINAQLGQLDEAMNLLQRSFAEGLPFSDEFHRDINLEPLWDHPPFRELIRPKG
jgi:DNA-binding winged helix-turn-helix (wHTH) protein/tetratricopeptide (TPR) repeat protein